METIRNLVPPFVHRPLTNHHIRLVRILPSQLQDDPIICRITVHDHRERPKYEALSYAWGDPQDGTQMILVDGRPFAIRLNLWLFLKQLREHCSVRVVWADAICIDQKNTEERNHQVKLMGDIYRHAYRTLIWLGPSNTGSDLLFDAILMTHRHLRLHWEFYDEVEYRFQSGMGKAIREDPIFKGLRNLGREIDLETPPMFLKLSEWEKVNFLRRKEHDRLQDLEDWYLKAVYTLSDSTMPTDLQSHSLATADYECPVRSRDLALLYAAIQEEQDPRYLILERIPEILMLSAYVFFDKYPFLLKALSDLSVRPYWRRLWIVQEIMLSHRIEIFCGSKAVSWDALALLLRICESSTLQNGRIVAASNASALYREWQKRHGRTKPMSTKDSVGLRGLELILDAFESSLCADIRDKIYGLLGLVETPLEPDYSKTPLELFSQLMELFKTSLSQEDAGKHQDPMSDLLHFGRLLQRSLRLDMNGSERGAKDGVYPSIAQVPGEIFGNILITASNVVGVEEIADALFDNWMTLRTPTALSDRQIAFARRNLLQSIQNLSNALARHSDESFASIQHKLFSTTLTQPGKLLAIKYSPCGHEPAPFRCKSPSGFTRRLCWFVYSLGRVGVSDVDVQEGDLICNCSGISPTLALVLRESSYGLQIVGRVMVSPVPFTNASSFGIEGRQDEAAVEDSKLEISFDALSLLAFVLLPFP